jgi:soluble lytic murein transglycosylase-like protein
VKPWILGPLFIVVMLIPACFFEVESAVEEVVIEEAVVEPVVDSRVPRLARAHQRRLTIIAQREMGLGAPVALFAAQIHQESAWRDDVAEGIRKSSVGAEGLAQFMPATAKWISELYPALGKAEPYNPEWAFNAMIKYDNWLLARSKGHTSCDKWWWALRSYNGGLGHIQRESQNAADPLDRHSVAAACGTARRSSTHCPENTQYPERIINRWEPIYLNSGWRGQRTC